MELPPQFWGIDKSHCDYQYLAMKRIHTLCLLITLALSIFVPKSALAEDGDTIIVIVYGIPVPKDSSELFYEVEQRTGQLDSRGNFTVNGTVQILISENELAFQNQVVSQYLTTYEPSSEQKKFFTVTATYVQPVYGTTLNWWAVAPKGGSGSGSSNLTGKPKAIQKNASKAFDLFAQAKKISGSKADGPIRKAIRILKKTIKDVKKEVKNPSSPVLFHPSMIQSPERSKTLAERALRTPEEKKRDRMLQASQDELDKFDRKLKKIAGQ